MREKNIDKSVLFGMLVVAAMSISCLWDYDTIAMERQQFPETLELITGKFLRHSPEFYYWRIRDREAKLKKSPDKLEHYDDMAVAYSKLGDDQTAVELMMQKESILPSRYETYANLGTFYIHSGQLKRGLEYINKAIEINPEAHFGREVYQKYLVEYLLTKQTSSGKILLPLNQTYALRPYPMQQVMKGGFFDFLVQQKALTTKVSHNQQASIAVDLQKAIQGVQGMMRFGNYNSTILLEVLADLLLQDGDYGAARQLAARAYILAANQMADNRSKELYERKATAALLLQYNKKGGKQLSIDDVKILLKEEIAEGNAFYDDILQSEHRWIIENKNLDLEFGDKYYQAPRVSKRNQPASGQNIQISANANQQLSSYQDLHFKVEIDTVMANFVDMHYATISNNQKEKTDNLNPTKGDAALPGSFIIYLSVGAVLILLIVLRLHRFRMGKLD